MLGFGLSLHPSGSHKMADLSGQSRCISSGSLLRYFLLYE